MVESGAMPAASDDDALLNDAAPAAAVSPVGVERGAIDDDAAALLDDAAAALLDGTKRGVGDDEDALIDDAVAAAVFSFSDIVIAVKSVSPSFHVKKY